MILHLGKYLLLPNKPPPKNSGLQQILISPPPAAASWWSPGTTMKAGSSLSLSPVPLSFSVLPFILGFFIAWWSEGAKSVRVGATRPLKAWGTDNVTSAILSLSNEITRPAKVQGGREIGSTSQWEEMQIPLHGAWVQKGWFFGGCIIIIIYH